MTAALNKRTMIPLTGTVLEERGLGQQEQAFCTARDSRKLHHTDEVLPLNLNILAEFSCIRG